MSHMEIECISGMSLFEFLLDRDNSMVILVNAIRSYFLSDNFEHGNQYLCHVTIL